jgi:hypothetical protein
LRLSKAAAREWKKCKDDPIYFIRKYIKIRHPSKGALDFNLYPWQEELIKKLIALINVIVLKSRQVGASWAIGGYIVWLIVFHPNIEVQIFSIGDRQAVSLMRKIKFMLRSIPRWMYDNIQQSARRLQITTTKLDTDSGERVITSISSIDSFPSSSDAGRGETPNFVFFDEHASQPNDEEIWASIQPALQHGGHCVSVSTPKGYDCVFARVFEQIDSGLLDGWGTMRVHYTDCGLDREWVKKNSVGMTNAQIRQEYELQFVQGENPVFDPSDLAACYRPLNHPKGKDGLFAEWNKYNAISGDGLTSTWNKEKFEYEYEELMQKVGNGVEFFTGVDSSEGKHKDQNSICTLNEFGIQVACEHNNMTLAQWAGFTDENGLHVNGFVTTWHKAYPGYLYIEENGPGLSVYERHVAVDDSGMSFKKRAHDNVQRTGLKTRIINDLVLMIAGRVITITDPKTYDQLMAYQRDEKTGKTSAPKGRLDDAVMSLAWAAHALKIRGVASFEMQAGRTGGNRIFEHDAQSILRVGSMQEVGAIGNAPRTDRGEFGIDARFGSFNMDRIRSLT